ncbi:MAG TPA: two-component regulator propeller domain-containing protein [Verrucomicrobiae bacterium]
MPTHRRKLQLAKSWLGVLTFAFSAILRAAEFSNSPFIIDAWSTRQGLPQSSVISIVQSADGYLWLGTLNGLVRFDGIRFTVFNESNLPGLDSDRIVLLFEDSRTNLWVGTDAGSVALLKNGKLEKFPLGQAGHEGRAIYAYEDAHHVLWFYTADGRMSYYQNGKMTSDPSMISLELVRRALKMLLPSRSGGFWQIQENRIQKWKDGRLEKDFGAFPWTETTIVTAACEDENGNLIVGTLGDGIFWYDANGKFQHLSQEQGLSSAFVLSLCLDNAGNLWVGTDGDGLNRLKRKIFNPPDGTHSLPAQSIAQDGRGGLWIAFNAFGISHWQTNSTQDFTLGPRKGAWAVLVDRRRQVWAGTSEEGLFLFQTNQFVPAPGAEILGPQIFALFEDRSGQLWAGTQNGLANFDGKKWKLFTTRDGLSENRVRAITQDVDGNLWVGTENGGLNFFKGGKFISYQPSENGLPGNDISCLYADPDGVLWIGTSGHGLARFQNGNWIHYSTASGLASDSISYLVEDGDGNLWIGSNAGLMRVEEKSLAAAGTNAVIFCRTYVETDGLPTRECSSGSQPAAIRAPDGKLFFPTTKGVVSLNPAELKPDLQPPPVLIESVWVDGREQKTNRLNSAWPQAIVIPPGREQLEVDYTALDFSAPEAVRFQYRLEGRDTGWTAAGQTRAAHYSQLSPGHYRFHVIACNEDGVWNKNGASLEITVQPQFWQTWWFRLAMVLVFLGIVVAIVRYFSTQKLQRELQLFKQQETLEKERGRIARDLHDQLGANLTQVALLGEMAGADKNSPDEIESHAQQISQTARETTRSLDEIVWAVNPSNDTLEGLANYACKYAQDYFALAGVRYRVDVPTQLPAQEIPPDVRHNAFLAFKEAVHNVVKHAHASEAWIRLRLSPDNFTLEIEDNGCGFGNPDSAQNRNGLRNMKKRMSDLRGEFSISPGKNGGTIIRLTVPII